LQILYNSPCRNTGTNTGASATDIVGTARPTDGTTDMGAYENPTITVLPVTFLSFEGKRIDNNTNFLTWQVSEEKGLSAYHVERSMDGKTFAQTGIVKAKGSNSVYDFTDNNPINGQNGIYYRLKMVDLDGKLNYSKIIYLESDKILRGGKIYPNPATDQLTVENMDSPTLQILNTTGQIMLSIKIEKTATLNIADLPKGVYFIQDGLKTYRFVKM
jgi:hypothetical protein